MRNSQKRGFSTLVVIASCLAGYVVLAVAFKWFVAPTAAKNHPVVATPPAAVVAVAPPQPTAAPAPAEQAPATRAPSGQSSTAHFPTTQFDLPSRYVVQRPPAPAPEPRAAKPRSSTTAAWPDTDAAAKKPVKKQVARTPDQNQPWYRQDQQRTNHNSWGNSWGFAGNGFGGSGRWF